MIKLVVKTLTLKVIRLLILIQVNLFAKAPSALLQLFILLLKKLMNQLKVLNPVPIKPLAANAAGAKGAKNKLIYLGTWLFEKVDN